MNELIELIAHWENYVTSHPENGDDTPEHDLVWQLKEKLQALKETNQ